MRRAMMIEWRELSGMTKIFYITGLVSVIGLAVMILTGMVGIGNIVAWKWETAQTVPVVYMTPCEMCEKLRQPPK
jgi:hypothetical protein